MIIGFDGSRAFTKNKTGTENYSFQILKHLSKIDIENSYKVYIRPSVYIDKKDWPNNFEFIKINMPRLWTQLGLSLRTFVDNLDVLFVPSHTLPLFRKPGLKTVMTIHDLGSEYLPQYHQIKQRLYLSFMIHYQIKTTSHLIAVSEATKKDLIKKIGVKPEKISVVYEGVNFTEDKIDSKRYIINNFDTSKNKYLLFVGTIQPRKNLERLIKSYHKFVTQQKTDCPNLVLAGGKGWLSEEIYNLPKELKIEDKVKFLGYVSDLDLPILYKNAEAFVFPSLFEGFGLPILEAMFYKIPVLTSNTSSLPEVAGDAAILVDPYSQESIYKGLIKISDKNDTTKLLIKASEQIKKFDWQKSAKETLEVLKQVAAT